MLRELNASFEFDPIMINNQSKCEALKHILIIPGRRLYAGDPSIHNITNLIQISIHDLNLQGKFEGARLHIKLLYDM
jgi:hypothetical protein